MKKIINTSSLLDNIISFDIANDTNNIAVSSTIFDNKTSRHKNVLRLYEEINNLQDYTEVELLGVNDLGSSQVSGIYNYEEGIIVVLQFQMMGKK